jgi:hypothetical protein
MSALALVTRREYIGEYMATTVHIPPPLLDALDKRAEALGVSRNRLIVTAIERELRGGGGGWPPGFFAWAAATDDDERAAVRELEAAIGKRRSSKRPPKL